MHLLKFRAKYHRGAKNTPMIRQQDAHEANLGSENESYLATLTKKNKLFLSCYNISKCKKRCTHSFSKLPNATNKIKFPAT